MDAASFGRRRTGRPLRCSTRRDSVVSGGPVTAELAHCRTCWEGEDEEEGGHLIAPCACAGTMRYVHPRCLTLWQQQLRASKGIAASRRCDVCKAPWGRAFQPPTAPTTWRQLLKDLARSMPWASILECWRFSVLAVGTVQGMRAGAEGFCTGMRWATAPSRQHMDLLARAAHEMALAAGVLPPLKAPMAFCLAAFVTGLALQVALVSMVCAYAGSVAGFLSGVAGSLSATLHLGTRVLHTGTLTVHTLACGAVRSVAATRRLAAPLLIGLLRILPGLALSRLIA